MHEMSLIDYALTAVENKAEEMNIEKVAEVGLVIGRLAALPELMEKAFEVVRTRHPKCADARLHLDMRDIRMRCRKCGCEYESSDAFSEAICPDCGAREHVLLAGDELLVDYFLPEQERGED